MKNHGQRQYRCRLAFFSKHKAESYFKDGTEGVRNSTTSKTIDDHSK